MRRRRSALSYYETQTTAENRLNNPDSITLGQPTPDTFSQWIRRHARVVEFHDAMEFSIHSGWGAV